VARYKNMLYSYGVADKKNCGRWRAWWKENRRFSMEEIRKRSQEEEGSGRIEAPQKDEDTGEKPKKEEEPDYGYE